ncbi:MAG: cadmium-translocating P-type ATPase [Spirochaetaceae bacterium]|nr:MAG: cadmium-translocating P-type ATPase [Spirochaetaceae bacterium]
MPDTNETTELSIGGMDCADCSQTVRSAISRVAGVVSVEVYLASEKAVVTRDPARSNLDAIRSAVENAGYRVRNGAAAGSEERLGGAAALSRRVLTVFGIMFGAVMVIVIAGEWFGLIDALTARVPYAIGAAAVVFGGFPVFEKVIRAAMSRRITSHALMSLGVVAALVIGEWPTAAVIVLFMRVGEYTESFTADRARHAVKDLTARAPTSARIERDAGEIELPIDEVVPGDVVIVRPGERIPVDGKVISGNATIDQAAITGESMPVEVSAGSEVFAATIAGLGAIRVHATKIGPDSTFGRVITMVEEAEANKSDVQRFADRFSGVYLPIVLGIAMLTFLVRRDAIATAAVLVVACSCSIALATPIAMLASVGAGAKRGLLIKGGKYLELLARADVLLIDKTGTLTFGRPRVIDVLPAAGCSREELIGTAASAEFFSEHPIAEALRAAGREMNCPLAEPGRFEAVPGQGVRADVDGRTVVVGGRRIVSDASDSPGVVELESDGKTVVFVSRDGVCIGAIAVADTPRPEVPAAVAAARAEGIRRIELLTGDTAAAARAIAAELGVEFRADLLPEDKIAIVREYQADGHTVVMVGDGVNDAPALAQADVGIAMGAAGSDVAIEAAHIALMRDDWSGVPDVIRIARRTMRIVKMNLVFTGVYNLIGLTLAAFGILPPILAAAAQSLPDLGILGNSSRLLRPK